MTATESARAAVVAGIVDSRDATFRAGQPAPSLGDIADAVLRSLDRAGFAVVDLSPWGECPGDEDGHRISPSLCAGCLEYDPD